MKRMILLSTLMLIIGGVGFGQVDFILRMTQKTLSMKDGRMMLFVGWKCYKCEKLQREIDDLVSNRTNFSKFCEKNYRN